MMFHTIQIVILHVIIVNKWVIFGGNSQNATFGLLKDKFAIL